MKTEMWKSTTQRIEQDPKIIIYVDSFYFYLFLHSVLIMEETTIVLKKKLIKQIERTDHASFPNEVCNDELASF